MKPYFLNVDLEIESDSKLDSLAAAMGRQVGVLHSGPGRKKRHLLTMEIDGSRRSPDSTIKAFCSLIEKLPAASRRIWTAAHKVFDAGFEHRKSQRYSGYKFRPETLRRIAKLGATLAVTFYEFDSARENQPARTKL